MLRDFEVQRRRMVGSLRVSGIQDERVLGAMGVVPRELFVGRELRRVAYADQALPIGMGQTISQPLMVATMTQALQLTGSERILEIGTGSGYQTALLALLSAYVYSIERQQSLACQAVRRMQYLGLTNISIYVADGSAGWPAAAPYERILVAAAAPKIPQQLLAQLVPGGYLVIPVGSQERQELLVVRRLPEGEGTEVRSLGGCVFVPLLGAGGWEETP